MKDIPGIDEDGNPKNGPFKLFFKNCEQRGTGGFDDEEQKHGAWKRYHANGQLWDEGRFEHGKKRGTWKVYDEAGELLKTQNFK